MTDQLWYLNRHCSPNIYQSLPITPATAFPFHLDMAPGRHGWNLQQWKCYLVSGTICVPPTNQHRQSLPHCCRGEGPDSEGQGVQSWFLWWRDTDGQHRSVSRSPARPQSLRPLSSWGQTHRHIPHQKHPGARWGSESRMFHILERRDMVHVQTWGCLENFPAGYV